MYAPQGVQLTGTNRPRTYHNQAQPNRQRVHYALLKDQTPRTTNKNHHGVFFTDVTAATAEGKRPDPFRTRKLSPPAPMVLPAREGGRVGHRRTQPTVRAFIERWRPSRLCASPNRILRAAGVSLVGGGSPAVAFEVELAVEVLFTDSTTWRCRIGRRADRVRHCRAGRSSGLPAAATVAWKRCSGCRPASGFVDRRRGTAVAAATPRRRSRDPGRGAAHPAPPRR